MLEKLAIRVGDAEPGVRAALRELLSTAVLPQIVKPALAPFIPLLTAHVGSAMTHISPDVRQACANSQTCAPPVLEWSPQSPEHTIQHLVLQVTTSSLALLSHAMARVVCYFPRFRFTVFYCFS